MHMPSRPTTDVSWHSAHTLGHTGAAGDGQPRVSHRRHPAATGHPAAARGAAAGGRARRLPHRQPRRHAGAVHHELRRAAHGEIRYHKLVGAESVPSAVPPRASSSHGTCPSCLSARRSQRNMGFSFNGDTARWPAASPRAIVLLGVDDQQHCCGALKLGMQQTLQVV